VSTIDAAIAEVARQNGVLLDRHDPVLIVRTLAEMQLHDHQEREERQIKREEKTLADMRQIIAQAATLIETAGKAAERPMLTGTQIREELIPALLAGVPWWCAIVGLVLMMAAGAMGYGLRWWGEPALEPIELMDGRAGFAYFTRGFAPPAPEPTPTPTPAPPMAPARPASGHKP
jgi:hypothetical protein